MDAPDFRRLVRRAMQAEHLSIAALARELGCSHETIGRWLRGKGHINSGLLSRILERLDIRQW